MLPNYDKVLVWGFFGCLGVRAGVWSIGVGLLRWADADAEAAYILAAKEVRDATGDS